MPLVPPGFNPQPMRPRPPLQPPLPPPPAAGAVGAAGLQAKPPAVPTPGQVGLNRPPMPPVQPPPQPIPRLAIATVRQCVLVVVVAQCAGRAIAQQSRSVM
eukprot:gene3389-3662_t